MKIGFLLGEYPPYYHKILTGGFQQLGIPFLPFNQRDSFDYVLIFNALLNTHEHDFSNIDDVTGKFGFIDFGDYGWWCYNPTNATRFHSAFAPEVRQIRPQGNNKLIEFLKGKSYPYFLREMYKNYPYHKNYHPVDYALPSESFPSKFPTTFEEYKNREWDVFLSWSPSHPDRVTLVEEIRKLSPKYKILATCDSPRKYDFETNIKLLDNCRLSLTYAGHGSGAIREYEVLARCTLLKNDNMYTQQPYPVVDNETCKMFHIEETFLQGRSQFVSTNINNVIENMLNNIEKAYEIYVNGYNHCMKYHTEVETAKYTIDVLQQHDWNEITI